MPVYEYKCGGCGEQFEITSSFSDRDEKAVCPVCGSRDVSAVFGGFSLGGYRTAQPGQLRAPEGQAAEALRKLIRVARVATDGRGGGQAGWPARRPVAVLTTSSRRG